MEKTGSKPIDELVRLAILGDGPAFTRLWDTHIDSLRAYIKKRINLLDDFFIDDICSRSFEKAFRQINTYDPSRSLFSTWLRTIARNTALDVLQSENRQGRGLVALDEAIADEEVESPLEDIIKSEDENKIVRLVEGLPALYREVARMRLIAGMQYKDIADELGMELNTVRTRIRRAKALIDKMKEDDEDESA